MQLDMNFAYNKYYDDIAYNALLAVTVPLCWQR